MFSHLFIVIIKGNKTTLFLVIARFPFFHIQINARIRWIYWMRFPIRSINVRGLMWNIGKFYNLQAANVCARYCFTFYFVYCERIRFLMMIAPSLTCKYFERIQRREQWIVWLLALQQHCGTAWNLQLLHCTRNGTLRRSVKNKIITNIKRAELLNLNAW